MKEYKRVLTEIEAANFCDEYVARFRAARETGGLHPRVTWQGRIPKYRLRDLEDYVDAKPAAEAERQATSPAA
jgi:hypothetical protein